MKKSNFYEILGIPPNATPEEIQKAYHRLALTHHPDVRKTPDAEERMKEINAAYEVLSDPEKRRQFDQKRVIKESPPIRPDRAEQHNRQPRSEPSPDPVSRQRQRPQPQWMSCAAGLLVFLLILVVMWVGTPQTTSAIPQVNPVVQVTPLPVVTVEKTFGAWNYEIETTTETTKEITTVPISKEYGNLSITSSPGGAQVFCNGQWKGFTPMVISHLEPNEYQIELKLSGYNFQTHNILINAGSTTSINANLVKVPVRDDN
jgi:hypothetical protein